MVRAVSIVRIGMYLVIRHTIVLQHFAQPPVWISRRHRDVNREKRQGLLQEDVSDDSNQLNDVGVTPLA